MNSSRLAESSAPHPGGPPGLLWTLCMAAALVGGPASPARAQEKFVLGGVLDAEVWKTDPGSELLSKNGGDPATEGRLRLWMAGEFHPRLQAFVIGEVEGGKASEQGTETELEQAFLRCWFEAPSRPVLEAGKIPMPVGNFARRYLSSVNPLIGAPLGYDISYPLGLQVSGKTDRFDYRVAAIDLPLANGFVPEASRALRPALAAGVTPIIGTRLGAYFTRGPYLNRGLEPLLPAGASWKDYTQRVVGLDFQFSRAHFELNGDFTWSRHDVPERSSPVRGRAYYIEPKYTWTPRFFTAVRFEKTDYPYIEAEGDEWAAEVVKSYDTEVGLGYRFNPAALLKVAYRTAHVRAVEGESSLRDGHSISAQLSYSFDVGSWLKRPR